MAGIIKKILSHHRVAQWKKVLYCSWQLAQQNRRAHRWRLWLSMVGIVVGTAALFSLLILNRGMHRKLQERLHAYGLNTLYWLPQTNSLAADQLNAAGEALYLTVEKLKQYEDVLTSPATPIWHLSAEVRCRDRHRALPLVVSSAALRQLLPIRLESGRFLPGTASAPAVCVVGHRLAAALLPPGHSPVGQTICIGTTCLTVVGVIYCPGSDNRLLPDLNSAVIVSPGTFLYRLLPFIEKTNLPHPFWLSRYRQHAAGVPLLASLLHQTYPLSSYEAWNPESLISEEKKTQRTLRVTLWSISVVAFLVGSIGMVNMIYSHTLERSVEIGIQKAVGATPLLIQWQFILETLLLGFYGWLAGMLLGGVFSYFISQQADIPWNMRVPDCLSVAGIALTLCLLSAWLPARKAALLPPARALIQHES
ncbi:MAG: hypothetical protein KatS3mg033_2231 [Thermonema sp.]|uniref:ABC transporter permease n=1 Tax=Thermonema sp. TaxID=2231181 RepID=UPI0021DD6F1E|nr:ABC transporter permease [Thermonema sp.]GIV40431.1 MAG: hypothetical protein KatS3mg033_2231 [Thermonema sp.]